MAHRNIDISALRAFIAVARQTSMAKAADDLHLTQGAISQKIKKFESNIDCQLFDRKNRSLQITEAGKRLLTRAEELVQLNDHVCAEMTRSEQNKKVRLGLPFDLVAYFISTVLTSYAETHPEVEVSIQCATSPELREQIDRNEIDLAIIEEPVGLPGGRVLTTDRLIWVGSGSNAVHQGRPLNVSLVSERCAFRDEVQSALEQSSICWKSVFTNGSLDATLAAVACGMAVTAWLESTIKQNPDIEPLAAGLPELPSFALKLYSSRGFIPPFAKEFASHIEMAFDASKDAATEIDTALVS